MAIEQANRRQQAVDGAVRLEHEAPARPDDDLGDHVRDEDEHPNQ